MRLPGLMALTLAAAAAAAPARGAAFRPLDEETTFAVVTHRGGLASGLSHDHFVVAPPANTSVEMTADPAAVEAGKFRATIKVSALVNDDPALHKKWNKRLQELGVMKEDFKDIEASDRAKIRAEMLGPDQLDAAKFPAIVAEVLSLTKGASKVGQVAFTHTATVRFEMHGKTVTKSVPAIVAVDGGALKVEAVGRANLTEFGIEPVSIMLGAIQVLDGFEFYVNFRAQKIP